MWPLLLIQMFTGALRPCAITDADHGVVAHVRGRRDSRQDQPATRTRPAGCPPGL